MAALAQVFNNVRYRKLLAKAEPRVIDSEEEYDRIDAHYLELVLKKTRTPEEEALYDLLGSLISDFEKRVIPPAPKMPPHELLKTLMEYRQLKAKDLVPLLGPSGRVSETLAGKRQVSKAQAKRLGEFFAMRPDAFI